MNSAQTAVAERTKCKLELKNSLEKKNRTDQIFSAHQNDGITAFGGNEDCLMIEISEPEAKKMVHTISLHYVKYSSHN